MFKLFGNLGTAFSIGKKLYSGAKTVFEYGDKLAKVVRIGKSTFEHIEEQWKIEFGGSIFDEMKKKR